VGAAGVAGVGSAGGFAGMAGAGVSEDMSALIEGYEEMIRLLQAKQHTLERKANMFEEALENRHPGFSEFHAENQASVMPEQRTSIGKTKSVKSLPISKHTSHKSLSGVGEAGADSSSDALESAAGSDSLNDEERKELIRLRVILLGCTCGAAKGEKGADEEECSDTLKKTKSKKAGGVGRDDGDLSPSRSATNSNDSAQEAARVKEALKERQEVLEHLDWSFMTLNMNAGADSCSITLNGKTLRSWEGDEAPGVHLVVTDRANPTTILREATLDPSDPNFRKLLDEWVAGWGDDEVLFIESASDLGPHKGSLSDVVVANGGKVMPNQFVEGVGLCMAAVKGQPFTVGCSGDGGAGVWNGAVAKDVVCGQGVLIDQGKDKIMIPTADLKSKLNASHEDLTKTITLIQALMQSNREDLALIFLHYALSASGEGVEPMGMGQRQFAQFCSAAKIKLTKKEVNRIFKESQQQGSETNSDLTLNFGEWLGSLLRCAILYSKGDSCNRGEETTTDEMKDFFASFVGLIKLHVMPFCQRFPVDNDIKAEMKSPALVSLLSKCTPVLHRAYRACISVEKRGAELASARMDHLGWGAFIRRCGFINKDLTVIKSMQLFVDMAKGSLSAGDSLVMHESEAPVDDDGDGEPGLITKTSDFGRTISPDDFVEGIVRLAKVLKPKSIKLVDRVASIYDEVANVLNKLELVAKK